MSSGYKVKATDFLRRLRGYEKIADLEKPFTNPTENLNLHIFRYADLGLYSHGPNWGSA